VTVTVTHFGAVDGFPWRLLLNLPGIALAAVTAGSTGLTLLMDWSAATVSYAAPIQPVREPVHQGTVAATGCFIQYGDSNC
jgi:hypothetical protein